MLSLGVVGWVYSAAIAAGVQAACPLAGASASGAVGLILVWAGGIPPSALHQLFEGLPYVQRPLVLVWNTVPAAWRAHRWWAEGLGVDAAVFAIWVVGGTLVAAWGAAWLSIAERDRSGP
jgi:hypothetical protein